MSHTEARAHPPGTVLRPPCGRRDQHAAAAGGARHRAVHHAALAAEGRRRLAALRRAALAGRPRALRRCGGGQSAADRVDLGHPDPARQRAGDRRPVHRHPVLRRHACWAAPGGPRRCCAAAAGCSRTGCRCSPRSAPCCWWCRPAISASASTCWSPPSCPISRCSPARWTASGRALRASLIAGVLAGLGCALKPRYAGVFVVLEGLALLRGLTPCRAMPLAAGATLLAYARTGRAVLSGLSAPRGAAGTGAVRRDRRAVPASAVSTACA